MVISSCQMAGWKVIRSGKSSKRPASMSKMKTHLDRSVKCPKFWVGPTRERPGPMLFMVVVTAVKFVIKSFSSREMRRIETTNKVKKVSM